MKAGKLNAQGSIAGDCWQLIYSTTLSSAATSLTISDLDGNTDEEYKLICRFVNGYNGTINVVCRPNNDSDSNYGRQYLFGNSTSVSAARVTSLSGIPVNYSTTLSEIAQSENIIYSKSGYVRTLLTKLGFRISGTTVTVMMIDGHVWNNTADNITSLVILADQTNGLGIGTVIELYKRVDKS